MKKTKLFVSLLMGFIAILCGYTAKTNAIQLNIDDRFFTGGILTGNYAEIHFQENNNDGYGVFFVGSGKTVDATLILTDRASTNKIKCNKQLNGYYIIPYTNYQVLGLDADTVSYTNENNLTNDINIITGGLFYGCRYDGYNYNTAINGIYGYIKREYGSNSDVKNIHEIRVGLKKPNNERTDPWDWHSTSPLQQAYSTTTGNHSRTLYGQFYSSLARSGLVSPRPIGDLKFTNSNITYSGDIDQYDISVYEYAENGINIQILSAKQNQTGTIELTYIANNGHPDHRSIDIQTHSSTNNFGFLGETFYEIKKEDIQIKPDSTGKITLTYPGENGNPDRSFSINFRITDENFYPCLTGYDYKFLTQDFWNQSPTNYNIKCAIFGYSGDSGYGTYSNYKTAYTSGRNDGVNCTQVEVEITSTLPDSLHDNTIYVLSGVDNDEITINDITMGECSAIVSPSKLNIGNDVTLKGGSITFNSNSKHSILDNISVKGGGIEFNNSENNTINMVKIYNTINGILINNNSQHILLNNVQSFNNNYGIKILNSASNAINNTQVYRNTNGVYMEGSTNNIIYNSNITLNNIGLFVTTGSENNIFHTLLVDGNSMGGTGKNIYVRNGLQGDGLINTAKFILQGSNYFMEYTGNTTIYPGYRTSLELSGYTRTMRRSPATFSYNYQCEGGTNGTCYLQAKTIEGNDYYLYNCTGTWHTIEEEGNIQSYRHITANGLVDYGNENTNRNIDINTGSQTFHVHTPEYQLNLNISNGFLGWMYEGFNFSRENESGDYINGEFFNEDNFSQINYRLTEYITVTGEITIEHEDGTTGTQIDTRIEPYIYESTVTGTWNEIFTNAYYTGNVPTAQLDSLGEDLCEYDGTLSGSSTGNETIYGNYTFYSSGPAFSTSLGLYTGGASYTNYMTNPELTHTENEKGNTFFNDWVGESVGKGGNIINTIKRYSYGVNVKTQKNILYPGEQPGGTVNQNYYIGSNTPRETIAYVNGYNNVSVTKIHYKLGIREGSIVSSDPKPTNYHIISLTGRGLDIINTILHYTGGVRSDWNTLNGQEWNNPYTYNYTGNNYMNIPLGSGIHIYTIPGSLTSYPIVFQIYNTGNYYFTHEYKTNLTRNDLTFTLSPSDYCLPQSTTDIVHMTGKRKRYERDTTGFYSDSLTINNTGLYKNNSFNHTCEIINGSFRKTNTGTYEWDIRIPCQTGELCKAVITFPTSKSSKVEDILKFKRGGRHSITYTYTRDRRAPELTINTGSAIYECKTKSISLSPTDTCAGLNMYEVFSEALNIHKTGILYNGATITGLDIGRTGNISKTGWVVTRDKYDNNYLGNILERNFKIKIKDAPVTISRGLTKANHLKYTGDGIINYYMTGGYAEITGLITGVEHAEIIVNPIELLGAQEGDCGTGDLYVDNVQCFTGDLAFSGIDPRFNFTGNVLSGQIIIENGKKTQRVKIFHENKKTFDIVTCAFNIKDNETGAGVTGYIGFRINTLHVPLIDPEIVSGTKYIDYSGNLPDRYDGTRQQYTHNENQKYSSGDLIYINLHANDCVKEYYASCDDYYYRSGILNYPDDPHDNNTGIARNNIPGHTGFYLSGCRGDDINSFLGRKTPIRISVRNGEYHYDHGFFTNTKDTENIVYDYNSPISKLRNTGNTYKIIAWNQTIALEVKVTDKFNINDYLVNDNGELDVSLLKLIIDTGSSCLCTKNDPSCFTGLHATFKPTTDYKIRILNITGTVNIRREACEGGIIKLLIDTGLVEDFAGNPSTKLDVETQYIYTDKTAIYVYEGTRLPNPNIVDRRVATKNIEWKIITGEIPLEIRTNLPLEYYPPLNTGKIACTGFNESGHFICLSIESTGDNHEESKQICKTRDIGGDAPYCENIANTGEVIFNNRYKVGFTICSGYTTDSGSDAYNIYINECTGRYSTNDTTGNWLIYGNIKATSNQYNEDYLKIQIYRQKSPFKAGDIRNETFFYGELTKALTDGDGDNGFIFYISHPQKIRTGNVSGGTIGEISYDLNFSTGVADEFYYITGEAIVNGFKQSRSIKRPTYNYSNPKGYLFNFPDYENYE